MKYCQNCGKQLKDEAVFCSGCGQKVHMVSETEAIKESEEIKKVKTNIAKPKEVVTVKIGQEVNQDETPNGKSEVTEEIFNTEKASAEKQADVMATTLNTNTIEKFPARETSLKEEMVDDKKKQLPAVFLMLLAAPVGGSLLSIVFSTINDVVFDYFSWQSISRAVYVLLVALVSAGVIGYSLIKQKSEEWISYAIAAAIPAFTVLIFLTSGFGSVIQTVGMVLLIISSVAVAVFFILVHKKDTFKDKYKFAVVVSSCIYILSTFLLWYTNAVAILSGVIYAVVAMFHISLLDEEVYYTEFKKIFAILGITSVGNSEGSKNTTDHSVVHKNLASTETVSTSAMDVPNTMVISAGTENGTSFNAEGMETSTSIDGIYMENGTVGEVITEDVISDKSKGVAAVLCFFLGALGIHRFYVGKVGTGVLMLLLTAIGGATTAFIVGWFILGFEGLWEIIDFIRILFGKMKDGQGKRIK